MQNLYIIAGPNGAGKTTASYTILPEIFNCDEFVNADEIAKGLSPFNPESVSMQAGRIMLERIDYLLQNNFSFAFETTLSTRSYQSLIKKAKTKGYNILLLFLTLDSPELAIERVQTRVEEGGHNIPEGTIVRRYQRGLQNLFNIYIPLLDNWVVVNNSGEKFNFVAEAFQGEVEIKDVTSWENLKQQYHVK